MLPVQNHFQAGRVFERRAIRTRRIPGGRLIDVLGRDQADVARRAADQLRLTDVARRKHHFHGISTFDNAK